MGSNDYFAPRPKNPLKYFWKNHKRVAGVQLPWRDLRDAFTARGWLDLTNAAGTLEVGGRRIAFAGVDDPHLRYDRYEKVAGPADPTADVRIALSHSPEPRVLDLFADDGRRNTAAARLPWPDLRDAFTASGWVDLTNRREVVKVGELSFAFAGVDDPHLRYDRLQDVAGPADRDADVRVGVAHAPYLRVLDQLAADGYDAILAGHTHGGQVCLPGVGALTTNCDLEPARAKGLHRHPAASRDGDPGSAWLHVSAGLGTSPYARIRVACRPEATLLTLVPRSR
jgi:predicted MPP superfamily phosphohydrolase